MNEKKKKGGCEEKRVFSNVTFWRDIDFQPPCVLMTNIYRSRGPSSCDFLVCLLQMQLRIRFEKERRASERERESQLCGGTGGTVG